MPPFRTSALPALGLLCHLPAVLCGQTAWPPILAEHYGWLAQDAVLLLVRNNDLQSYLDLDDELIFKLRSEGQLVINPLPSKVAEDLWAARGWGNSSHWFLVNAQGEEGGSGVKPPSGQSIVAFLGTKGVRPRWEVRDAFLKDHPTHGEAWGEAVQRGFTLARYRLRGLQVKGLVKRQVQQGVPLYLPRPTYTFTSPVPEVREQAADQVFGDCARALEGLRGVEHWLDRPNLAQGFLLKIYGAGTSPLVRNVCKLMLHDLEVRTRQEPEGVVSYEWSVLSDLAGNPKGQLPQDLVLLPGGVWPSLPFITTGVSAYLLDADWDGALAFLAGAAPQEDHALMNPASWEQTRMIRAVVALEKVFPLLQLGKEDEALAALAEARRWSGTHWRSLVDDGIGLPLPKADPRLSERVRTSLNAPPLPDPPSPPAPAPLRMSLFGQPPWQEAWGRLRHGEELLPWSPAELSWTTVNEGPSQTLRAQQPWGPEPRWVLFRGEEILASGTTCPTAGALAGLLAAQGPSALQRLDAILERHPEHNAARRARLEMLKARMPEPRLEALLVADERAVWHDDYTKPLPLDFGPEALWKPDPALWQWAATQALPRIQDKLEQWPGSAALWIDWVSWSQFHPKKPSPVDLAWALPIWGSRNQWARSLSFEVHKAVGQVLKARGDLGGLVAWYSLFWEAEPKTPAGAYSQENWDKFTQGYLKDFGEAVVKPLEASLVSLGRSAEAREVERTFRTMSTR